MTKTEVLKALSEELSLTQAETEQIYDTLVDHLTQILAADQGFTLPALGSFSSETRPPRVSFNPHYGKKMMNPKKKAVRFSQSTVIREELNENHGGTNE